MPEHIAAAGWTLIAIGALIAAAAIDHRDRSPIVTTTIHIAHTLAAVPARGWVWITAGHRWRHQTAAAERAGVGLLAGMAALAALAAPTREAGTDWRAWVDEHTGNQERCTCGARRCDNQARGVHCPPQRAPKLTDTLGGDGRHEPAAVLRRIVDGTWLPPRPLWQPLAARIGALPRPGALA